MSGRKVSHVRGTHLGLKEAGISRTHVPAGMPMLMFCVSTEKVAAGQFHQLKYQFLSGVAFIVGRGAAPPPLSYSWETRSKAT